MSRIAVLGTGAMGSRIAQNLLNANYQVIVYNRTAAKAKPLVDRGAIFAATPREAAEQANVVMGMVTDNDISQTVWLDSQTGAVAGLSKDSIAIESSTLSVDWTRELATEIERCEATFLDAPIVGSRPQAEAGQLIYLVGGKAETLAQVQPVLLSAGASGVHHIGSVGQGMLMKLAVNALFGIQVAALAETIGLLVKAGISPEKAMACLSELPVISPAAKGAGSLMVVNRHAPLFPIELVEKDLRYLIDTAQGLNASTPASTAIYQIYQAAIAKGHSDDNITGVAQLFI